MRERRRAAVRPAALKPAAKRLRRCPQRRASAGSAAKRPGDAARGEAGKAAPPTKSAAPQAIAATSAPAAAVPAPAPVAPVAVEARAEPAAPASFRAGGDATGVVLVANGKRYSPGEVPPGTYTIEASFGGQAPTAAGSITLAAGQSVTIQCNGAFMKCR
jgi:3-oxoacyl-ACP reductase-like protein